MANPDAIAREIQDKKLRLLDIAETKFSIKIVDRLKPIASGGYGSVYKARSLTNASSYFAVKVQIFGRPSTSEAKQLADEAVVLEDLINFNYRRSSQLRLKHERHILTVQNFFDSPGLGRAILTNYAHYGTMEAHVYRRGYKMNSAEIEYYFNGIVDGLADLHRNKITHNDPKLLNILLMYPDEQISARCHDLALNFDGAPLLLPAIADFGLSFKYKEPEISVPCGTRCYWCFELLMGRRVPAEVPDLFALGVCLFEMITGRMPFHHRSFMSAETIRKITSFCTYTLEKMPTFTAEEKTRAGPFYDLCCQLIAFDPDQRITTMALLRERMPGKNRSLCDNVSRTFSKAFKTNPTHAYEQRKKKDLGQK